MWELVASLLDLENEIEVIKRNPTFGGDCELFFREVLVKWESSRCKPYTWQTILDVLSAPIINQKELADTIARALKINKRKGATDMTEKKSTCKNNVIAPQSNNATSSISASLAINNLECGAIIESTSIDIELNDEVEVEYIVAQEIKKFKISFKRLKSEVKKTLKQMQISAQDIYEAIEDDIIVNSDVDQEKLTIESIFDIIIESSCSYHNYSLLGGIVYAFLGDTQLQNDFNTYSSDFEQFCNSNVLENLKQKLDKVPKGRRISLKLTRRWDKTSVKDFQVLIQVLFHEKYLNKMTVQEGCICVSWIIPEVDTSKIVKDVAYSPDFMKAIGVLLLTMGDDVIFELTQEQEDMTLDSALVQALDHGPLLAVELLLAVGGDPHQQLASGDTVIGKAAKMVGTYGMTVLHVACQYGHSIVVSLLLKANANINSISCNGWTPLMKAAYHGHCNIVELLLTSTANPKANVNILSKDGETALYFASYFGHCNIASTLIEAGADANLSGTGYTPLEVASYNGHNNIVQLLLDHTDDIDGQIKARALYQACEKNQLDVIHTLINFGTNPFILINGEGYSNENCFQVAYNRGQTTAVKKILKTAHKSNAYDTITQTFFAACNNGLKLTDVANVLLQFDYDICACEDTVVTSSQDIYRTLLMLASMRGHLNVVKTILYNVAYTKTVGYVNMINKAGETALYLASLFGHYDIASILLDAGADANLSGARCTPLEIASCCGHNSIVQLLLHNTADDDGCIKAKALHGAYKGDHIDVMCTLLINGANPSSLTSPFLAAFKNRKNESVELIFEAARNIIPTPCAQLDEPIHDTLENVMVQPDEPIHDTPENVMVQPDEPIHDTLQNVLADLECMRMCAKSPLVKTPQQAHIQLQHELQVTKLHFDDACTLINLVLQSTFYYVDINLQDATGATALYMACEMNAIQIANDLLIKGGADPNIKTEDKWTPLMIATIKKYGDIVILLLKYNVDVNLQNIYGATALYMACKNNAIHIATDLLKSGADPNIKTNRGQTPLILATIKCYGDMVKLLLEYNVDVNHNANGATALYIAYKNNFIGIVTDLLKCGADPTISSTTTPLMLALSKSHDEMVIKFTKYSAKFSNLGTKEASEALYIASAWNAIESATNLLKAGTDPNKTMKRNGWTPLMIATMKGFDKIVKLLLQYNVDVDIQSIGGDTALSIACENNDIHIATALLKGGADPNIQKRNGWTPLMIATMKGFDDIINLLIQYNVDADLQNINGDTALSIACENNAINIATDLLKGGADPNIQKRNGWTPLMIAILKGHENIVELLLQYGANTKIQYETGESALYIACRQHHASKNIKIITDLLKAGADPNIKTMNGWSPLMISSIKNYADIVDTLLYYGADPNLSSPTNQTPLMLASEKGCKEVVQVLLQYPRVADGDTAHALMLATQKGHRDIVELLLPLQASANKKGLYRSVSQISLVSTISSHSSGIESDRGSIITGTTISSGSTTASLRTDISVDSGIEVGRKKDHKDGASIVSHISVDSGVELGKKKKERIERKEEHYEKIAPYYLDKESIRKQIEEVCVKDPTLQ